MTALSILSGREERYNDRNHWWSLMPKEIDTINNLTAEEQVIAQIYYTYNQIYSDIQTISNDDYYELQYERLCDDPNYELEKLGKYFGIEIRPNILDKFTYNNLVDEDDCTVSILKKIEQKYIKKLDR